MKIQALICFFSLSTPAWGWRVDRRCLKEGQLLAGEDVEQMLAEGGAYEEFELDDTAFGWDDYPLLDTLEDETSNLRGNRQVIFQNQTSHYSNTSRNLQSGREFNLKLTWKQGACWQDEWIERKWCMECRRNCNSGDVLEVQKCSKKWTQRFEWDGGRIKVASKNMCLTNSGGLRLRSCGGSGQNFRGYRSSGGFQLKPSSNSKCLSQHHHPKAGEIIELVNCGTAASHDTDKWNVYWPTGSSSNNDDNNRDNDSSNNNNNNNNNDNGGGGSGSLTKRGRECSSSNPCGKCEGDCDNDSDCKGNLQCKQRYGSSAFSSVPGCSGSGVKGLDYCY